MTTWHENEPLEDVAEFFLRGTCFDTFFPSRFVAVCIGEVTSSAIGFAPPSWATSRDLDLPRL